MFPPSNLRSRHAPGRPMIRPRRTQLQIEPNGSNPGQTRDLVPILSIELKTRAGSWPRDFGFRENTKALAGSVLTVKSGTGYCVRTIKLMISRCRCSSVRERAIKICNPTGGEPNRSVGTCSRHKERPSTDAANHVCFNAFGRRSGRPDRRGGEGRATVVHAPDLFPPIRYWCGPQKMCGFRSDAGTTGALEGSPGGGCLIDGTYHLSTTCRRSARYGYRNYIGFRPRTPVLAR